MFIMDIAVGEKNLKETYWIESLTVDFYLGIHIIGYYAYG